MKRIISLILALCMLTATFVLITACAEKEDNKKNDNVDVENKEDNYMVGEYDFGGEMITFPIFGGEPWYLDVEEKVGETVEDAKARLSGKDKE